MTIRNTYWNGGEWVDVTDDAAIAANFLQQLLLIRQESPLDAVAGIPSREIIETQGSALFYLLKVRERFLPYFAAIDIQDNGDGEYAITVQTNGGTQYANLITV